jgi:hypothetical protein
VSNEILNIVGVELTNNDVSFDINDLQTKQIDTYIDGIYAVMGIKSTDLTIQSLGVDVDTETNTLVIVFFADFSAKTESDLIVKKIGSDILTSLCSNNLECSRVTIIYGNEMENDRQMATYELTFEINQIRI